MRRFRVACVVLSSQAMGWRHGVTSACALAMGLLTVRLANAVEHDTRVEDSDSRWSKLRVDSPRWTAGAAAGAARIAPEAILFAISGRLDPGVDLAVGRFDGAAAWCDGLTEGGRKRARSAGLYLDTYVVNSPIDLAMAVAFDVDMIESDDVPTLLSWFD